MTFILTFEAHKDLLDNYVKFYSDFFIKAGFKVLTLPSIRFNPNLLKKDVEIVLIKQSFLTFLMENKDLKENVNLNGRYLFGNYLLMYSSSIFKANQVPFDSVKVFKVDDRKHLSSNYSISQLILNEFKVKSKG